MSASEYLSAKIEGESRDPLRASAYTGSAYIATVALLILPFFILENVFHALGLMVAEAIAMILVFTFYVSVSKDIPFKKRFLEMTAISLGIAVLTFAFGFFVKSLVI
jgi:VIT1/CCC1 family predicted Fe2+/Mn2+ transporter